MSIHPFSCEPVSRQPVSRRRRGGQATAALAILAVTGHGTPASPPPYRAPVVAPVVDHFRPPATPYGPGNRGLDYGTVEGAPVRAVGDGRVTFAGPIARHRYVTVLHPDGLRSSLSFLATVTVRVGDDVRRGQVVGTASERIQLGFRRGDQYLDPAGLLGVGRARLLPPPRRSGQRRRRHVRPPLRSPIRPLLGSLLGSLVGSPVRSPVPAGDR